MKTNQLMRHITSAILIGMILFTCMNLVGINREDVYGAAEKTATIYVTISVKGDIAVADGKVMAEVPVKVKTADGMTTIDAVMEAFHKEYKPGGYICDQFVSKLWGIETSNTLFFINNLSITSGVKSEPVKNGDRIIASVNADDKHYSDYFSYFGKTAITGITGDSVTLSLQGFMGMTQNADPQAIPNAEVGIVTKDGFQELDGIVTDQDGKVVIQLDKDTFQAGKTYYLSARGTVSTTVTDWNTEGSPAVNVDAPLIAPICKISVDSKVAAGVKATRITDLKTKVSKGKVVLTWKKTAGYKTEGYQIYRSAKKDGVYRSIGKTAARKYTNKSSLKKGTRYYYKVRGYRTVDKKTVYTKWSQTVSAKAR